MQISQLCPIWALAGWGALTRVRVRWEPVEVWKKGCLHNMRIQMALILSQLMERYHHHLPHQHAHNSSPSQSSPEERLRLSSTGSARRRTMRQLAMIYPTFTPASTSSVVSSAFDTSHAPELPTGQTACWRLIFTRLATDLFSLGSKLTYFHSASN